MAYVTIADDFVAEIRATQTEAHQLIELGKLCVSKANMRHTTRVPDVSDILPTVRKRGVIVPVLV